MDKVTTKMGDISDKNFGLMEKFYHLFKDSLQSGRTPAGAIPSTSTSSPTNIKSKIFELIQRIMLSGKFKDDPEIQACIMELFKLLVEM